SAAVLPRPRAGFAGASVGSRRSDAAAVDPNHRAVPVTRWSSSRSWRLNASIRPTAKIARQTMNAPGPVKSGSSSPARNRPIRPPPRSAPNSVRSRISNAPRKPTYARPIPASVAPQPELGRLPGPHSRYQPAPRRRNGRAQRPVSNHGAIESRHQSVSAPCPGRARAISVTAPSTRRQIPKTDRATSGGTDGKAIAGRDWLLLRRRVVGRRVRRFVATLNLDHDGEDHRPPLGLLVQVARDAVLDLALQQGDLADVVARVLDGGEDPLDRLAHHRV